MTNEHDDISSDVAVYLKLAMLRPHRCDAGTDQNSLMIKVRKVTHTLVVSDVSLASGISSDKESAGSHMQQAYGAAVHSDQQDDDGVVQSLTQYHTQPQCSIQPLGVLTEAVFA